MEKGTVQSVDKALHILNLFKIHHELALIDVVELTGYPKTTAFSMLSTLVHNDYLEKTYSGKYRLGVAMFTFAVALSGRVDIKEEAADALQALSNKYSLNTHITLLDDLEMIYVDSYTPPRKFMQKTIVGSTAPANCTSTGKAFLACLPMEDLNTRLINHPLQAMTTHSIVTPLALQAELERIRHDGYSVDNEESILGVRGIGVVVKNKDNSPFMGLSIAGSTDEMTPAVIENCAADLKLLKTNLEIKCQSL
ncbi:MAG: IclR family transcriptional regulator [Ruminococcaceae bacterium]|nr:IclR family transcriptional regulator [Oscillospiraceae bacterium]